MVFVNKNFTTFCPNDLLDAINSSSSISQQCLQIVNNLSTSDFEFASNLSGADNTALDNLLNSWVCPVTSSSITGNLVLFSDQFLNPNTSGWAVNQIAPVSVDTINSDLLVRRFDDTTEEGIGLQIKTPSSTTSVKVRFRLRPQSSQAANRVSVIKLYFKELPKTGTLGSWSSISLGSVSIPSGNTNWLFYEQTLSSTFDADSAYLLEITRDSTNASDTLVGDLVLMNVEVEFE
jgi:hypothetical protein